MCKCKSLYFCTYTFLYFSNKVYYVEKKKTTLVAEPVDEVKDAISAGVEALNAKPADEEVEADILVIETPDVEIDNDTDEVQTPETLVNEAITPLTTATGDGESASKSVDQARQRSPTPQIESDEEEEVVEPSHVETVDTKVAETPVDKPVASKETIGTVVDYRLNDFKLKKK